MYSLNNKLFISFYFLSLSLMQISNFRNPKLEHDIKY